MERVLVTGGAGFIGSHLVKGLLSEGYGVRVIDNLVSGSKENLDLSSRNLEFIKGDLLSERDAAEAVKRCAVVFHLAANPNVRDMTGHFRENVFTTNNILDACSKQKTVKRFYFTSTSTVYGNAKILPTPEAHPFSPISMYGATKAACESLICGYCNAFGFEGTILRLANIIGPRAGHGVIPDFIKKLTKTPSELEILGNGLQKKSYLFVDDVVDAFLLCMSKNSKNRVEAFNVGSHDAITTREIARIVIGEMGLKNVRFRCTGGVGGWKGDVPKMLLSTKKIEKVLGWKPTHTSVEAVRCAARSLIE